MIPEKIQFRNSNKHRKPLIQQSQGPEPMSIEPPYPQQQVYNQPHQNYQPNYPSQNFNEMGFQQHSGFQQQYSNTSYQHQQNYNQNGSFSTGNTGNFYNPILNTIAMDPFKTTTSKAILPTQPKVKVSWATRAAKGKEIRFWVQISILLI